MAQPQQQQQQLQQQQQQQQQQQLQAPSLWDPISKAGPTPEDLQNTKELEELIRRFGAFDDEAGMAHRQLVLGKLNEIVREWIKEVRTHSRKYIRV